jgi:hypothetical protein
MVTARLMMGATDSIDALMSTFEPGVETPEEAPAKKLV